LTWHDTAEGYRVFFNRDERYERGAAVPPSERRSVGGRYLAPLDGDAGGTWIAVNEHGLTLCLLNGFPEAGAAEAPPARGFTSRGAIPLLAIACRTPAAVGERVRAAELACFRPFVLVAFAPGRAGLVARWSGVGLAIDPHRPAEPPLISSSFCTDEVRASRRTVYGEVCGAARESAPLAAHLAFHASHRPERGPRSPCMHRPDAATVSFSRVDVSRSAILFHYAPHAPCRGLPGAPAAVLPRAADGAPPSAG
jgi:hypothetical protein